MSNPTTPTPAPVETPRTDGFIKAHHEQWPRWSWQDDAGAYADFARTLERELAAKDAEIYRLRRSLTGDNEGALLVSELTGQCQELNARAEKAEQQAREAVAALAAARETLDWAEAILCNAQPMGHCTQQEWDKIIHRWRDQKHAARAQEEGAK